MSFVETDMEQEARELQIMIETDPELQAVAKEFDREYELRKRLVSVHKEISLMQDERLIELDAIMSAISAAAEEEMPPIERIKLREVEL